MAHPHWLRCSVAHKVMALTLPYADGPIATLRAAKEALEYFSEHYVAAENAQPITRILIHFEKENAETEKEKK